MIMKIKPTSMINRNLYGKKEQRTKNWI